MDELKNQEKNHIQLNQENGYPNDQMNGFQSSSTNDYSNKQMDGINNQSMNGYPYPSTNDYSNNQMNGINNQSMNGYPYSSMNGYPNNQMVGVNNQSMNGYPYPSMNGYSNNQMNGINNQSMNGYPYPSMNDYSNEQMNGYPNQPMYGYQNDQVNGFSNYENRYVNQNQPVNGFVNRNQTSVLTNKPELDRNMSRKEFLNLKGNSFIKRNIYASAILFYCLSAISLLLYLLLDADSISKEMEMDDFDAFFSFSLFDIILMVVVGLLIHFTYSFIAPFAYLIISLYLMMIHHTNTGYIILLNLVYSMIYTIQYEVALYQFRKYGKYEEIDPYTKKFR